VKLCKAGGEMRIMPRFCKRKREQGWVELGGEMISTKVQCYGLEARS
jgi:hypothetical protein